MAFDGNGVFLRLRNWVADATAGVKIRADFHDLEDDNFASGISNCIAKDGQTTVTQNIPLNSKRITALADPVDPQDAATRHYADTKMPLDGSVPITGDVIVRNNDPSITLDGQPGFNDVIYGDKNSKHRWALVLGNVTAEGGSDAGSDFELINYHDDGTLIGDALFGSRATGLLTVKANPTAALGIATKQYADTKLALTGGTINGSVTINSSNLTVLGQAPGNGQLYVQGITQLQGELAIATPHLSFSAIGSLAFLEWIGGNNYRLGSGGGSPGGTIWHSGNFIPTTFETAIKDLLDRVAVLEARLDPQADLGNKRFDPATGTFSDLEPPPPQVRVADDPVMQSLAAIHNRLDALERK